VPAFTDFWTTRRSYRSTFWAGARTQVQGLVHRGAFVTRLCILAAGGGKSAYFRNPDGSLYTPPMMHRQTSRNTIARNSYGPRHKTGYSLRREKKRTTSSKRTSSIAAGTTNTMKRIPWPTSRLRFRLPDSNGIFQNSLVTGLFFDAVVIHPEQRKRTG